jgi:hypothetical protein
LTIFGEKIGVFLKNQCYDQNFAYFSFVLSQKCQFFRQIFWRKYLKNHNIGPRIANLFSQRIIAHLKAWAPKFKPLTKVNQTHLLHTELPT